MKFNRKEWYSRLRNNRYEKANHFLFNGIAICPFGIAFEMAVEEGLAVSYDPRNIGDLYIYQWLNSSPYRWSYGPCPELIEWMGLNNKIGVLRNVTYGDINRILGRTMKMCDGETINPAIFWPIRIEHFVDTFDVTLPEIAIILQTFEDSIFKELT